MREIFCFVVIYAVVILLRPGTTFADHDMTCHPPESSHSHGGYFMWSPGSYGEPGEELNLIVPGAGGATSTSCSGAGAEPLPVLLVLPDSSFSAVEHIPGTGEAGRYWLFESVSQTFLDDHIGLSAELPNFTKPDGTPLLAQYNESGLDFLLQADRDFEEGESLSVSGGQIFAWPAVTLREMPGDFDLDQLFPPDPGRFPLYSGLAQLADIAIYTVVPEPGTLVLLSIGALGIAARRKRLVSKRNDK